MAFLLFVFVFAGSFLFILGGGGAVSATTASLFTDTTAESPFEFSPLAIVRCLGLESQASL